MWISFSNYCCFVTKIPPKFIFIFLILLFCLSESPFLSINVFTPQTMAALLKFQKKKNPHTSQKEETSCVTIPSLYRDNYACFGDENN